MDALQNLFGVENNQVLIRKYEIIGVDFEHAGVVYGNVNDRESYVVDDKFKKYPPGSDDFADYECIDIVMLKEFVFHLLEKPVDDVKWLRIKQPGTYIIHFDLICSPVLSFSFELHKRDEIIHFSEHNPKNDINLEN